MTTISRFLVKEKLVYFLSIHLQKPIFITNGDTDSIIMDEDIDTENSVHHDSVQIKIEPNVCDMSTAGTYPGTESSEQYPDSQTSGRLRGYKSDINPTGTDNSSQNVEVKIKQERIIDDMFHSFSCDVTEATDQSSDHNTGNSSENTLCVHERPSSLLSNDTTYAVSIKYELNSWEGNESSMKYESSVNSSNSYDNLIEENGHCVTNSSQASDNTFIRDIQLSSCEPMGCESNETHSYTHGTITEQSAPYHEHDHTYSACYKELNTWSSNVDVRTLENTHKEQKLYRCDICSFNAIYASDLTNHKQQKHLEEVSHTSDICSFSTTLPRSLVTCNRKHIEEKPYKCDVTDMRSSISARSNDLVKHKRKHTGGYPYKCDVCDYGCYWFGTLVRHKQKHTGEKPYKCDVCDYGCYWFGTLMRHKRKHTGEKLYKCDMCSYSTSWSGYLVRHKRKLTGEKLYTCDMCSYSTSWSGDLVRHKRKHTGDKPYKCDVCSYSTSSSGALVGHKRKHTGEKPYKCDVCSYETAWSGDLVAHKRRKHTTEKLNQCSV